MNKIVLLAVCGVLFLLTTSTEAAGPAAAPKWFGVIRGDVYPVPSCEVKDFEPFELSQYFDNANGQQVNAIYDKMMAAVFANAKGGGWHGVLSFDARLLGGAGTSANSLVTGLLIVSGTKVKLACK